jgi:hypothetical protein
MTDPKDTQRQSRHPAPEIGRAFVTDEQIGRGTRRSRGEDGQDHGSQEELVH